MVLRAAWPLLLLLSPHRDLRDFLSVGVDAEDDWLQRLGLRFSEVSQTVIYNLRGDFTKEKFENLNPLLSREKKAKLFWVCWGLLAMAAIWRFLGACKMASGCSLWLLGPSWINSGICLWVFGAFRTGMARILEDFLHSKTENSFRHFRQEYLNNRFHGGLDP